MPRTTTKQVSFERLNAKGKSAVIVIKLMMACNDLQLVNEALYQWKDEKPISKKHRKIGAGMYFLRAQLSHLHEGLKIIQEIMDDESLMKLVNECDRQTQKSFRELEKYLSGGSKSKEFNKIVGRVRHSLTFHYDESGKQIQKAVTERSGCANARMSTITRGSHAYLWHFKVADDVIDSIVCRQIWGIPKETDLRKEADKVADETYSVFLSFMDFAGEFIWRYHS